MGAGADTMKWIVAPLVGGIFTSFLLELPVYPTVYEIWKWHFELRRDAAAAAEPEREPPTGAAVAAA